MTYFNTRRAGEIQRRLLGMKQVREFLVTYGSSCLTAITQLSASIVLMFIYSAKEVAESYTQLRREGLAGTAVIKEKQTEVSRLTGQLELLRNEQRDTRAALEKLSLDEQLQLNEYRQRERALKDEIEKAKIMIATRS